MLSILRNDRPAPLYSSLVRRSTAAAIGTAAMLTIPILAALLAVVPGYRFEGSPGAGGEFGAPLTLPVGVDESRGAGGDAEAVGPLGALLSGSTSAAAALLVAGEAGSAPQGAAVGDQPTTQPRILGVPRTRGQAPTRAQPPTGSRPAPPAARPQPQSSPPGGQGAEPQRPSSPARPGGAPGSSQPGGGSGVHPGAGGGPPASSPGGSTGRPVHAGGGSSTSPGSRGQGNGLGRSSGNPARGAPKPGNAPGSRGSQGKGAGPR